jgi:hypothetical protein
MEAWRNSLVYLTWRGGFSESLIKRWFYWTAETNYLLLAAGFGFAPLPWLFSRGIEGSPCFDAQVEVR